MAVPPVSATPDLVFSGEGHVRDADPADAAAVVLGHEAGNLLNFQAIAAARGGYVKDEQIYVRLGFVDGQLTVVGGTSTAVIVAPPPYQIPSGNGTSDAASAPPSPIQTTGLNANADLLSADGASPTPAPPPETSVPVNATIPAPPPEVSLQTTDVSANLQLSPNLTPNAATNETALANTRQALAIADDQNEPQAGYLFASNVFSLRANFQYEPFAGLGRDPLKPFSPTEIPRLFVDGAY